MICCTGLNCFLAIWAKKHEQCTGFLPKPTSNRMCQRQRVAKVLLSNIYFVILRVSQHVFLLGFFFVCMRVRHISNIWMRKSKLPQEITYLHTSFSECWEIFCQFCQLTLCNCLFLGTTICSLCDKIIKFRRKLIRTNFDHEFIMYRVLEFKLQDFT